MNPLNSSRKRTYAEIGGGTEPGSPQHELPSPQQLQREGNLAELSDRGAALLVLCNMFYQQQHSVSSPGHDLQLQAQQGCSAPKRRRADTVMTLCAPLLQQPLPCSELLACHHHKQQHALQIVGDCQL
jgi:hypothetical protein